MTKKRNNNNNKKGLKREVKKFQRWDNLPTTNDSFVNYYKNIQKIFEKKISSNNDHHQPQKINKNSNNNSNITKDEDEDENENENESIEKVLDSKIKEKEDHDDDDEQWKSFFDSLRSDLPTTFRITGEKHNVEHLNRVIEDTYIPFLSKLSINDQPISPPKKIPWYPKGLAWEIRTSKQLIRKSSELKKFQNFLVYETEAGNISRQEAVSMIPPLLLDVQPHHFVLDTCAAPGSKTAQLVEFLHQSPDEIPTGLLIANDSDYKRSHLLVHQSLRRLPSPSTMITNHDATRFPSLSLDKGSKLMFDRILCDVPCSGDGTLRKNGGIWRDWTPANGIGLHGLQLRILSRAISLLKPGGRLVYSTCSLNPIENEAVVSAALNKFPSMSLIDVSDRLKELRRSPGMLSWKVTRRELDRMDIIQRSDIYNDKNKGPKNEKGALDSKKYPITLWPNGNERDLGLERCLRIYPHLQDTGGFFVAVFEKRGGDEKQAKSDLQSSKKASASDRISEPNESDPVRKRQKLGDDNQGNVVDEKLKEESHSNGTSKNVTQTEPTNLKEETEKGDIKSEIKEESDKDHEQEKVMKDGEELNENGEGEGEEALRVDSQAADNDQPMRGFKEDPYTYVDPNNEEIKICLDFFEIDPSFPIDNLLVRNESGIPNRTIYLTSSVVKKVINNNSHERLRLICSGVKIFGKQDQYKSLPAQDQNRCKWRLISDGVEFVKRFISAGSKRLVEISVDGLKQLVCFQGKDNDLQDQYPLFESLKDEKFRREVEGLESGSCLARVVVGDGDGGRGGSDGDGEGRLSLPRELIVGLWISKSSVNLMVDKKERRVLSLRLWGEDLTEGKAGKERVRMTKAAGVTEKGVEDEVGGGENVRVEEVAVEDEVKDGVELEVKDSNRKD